MRRRALLTTLASGSALLAGCAAGDPTGTDPRTDTDTSTPGGTEPSPTEPTGAPDEVVELDGNALFGASVVDLETADRTYALSPMRFRTETGAEVRMRFDATATAEHPARLVASIQNVDEYPEQFDLDWLPPFGRPSSEPPREHHERLMGAGLRDEGSLVLAPTPNHDLVNDPPAVERDADGHWRLAGGIDRWLPETLTLDVGEAVRGEYAVVGHPEGSGRPTGVYEFLRPGDAADASVTVWQTSAPGPDGESRFAGESVPSIGGDGEAGLGWYHTADASSGAYLRPETERADLPAGITFQFVNHTREELGCGHWYVYKLHDGEWFDLGPYVRTAECRMVPPAGTKSWTLHAYRGGGSLPPENGRAYPFLGGGRYAVSVGYGDESSSSTAMIELTGDPIEIVPTDDVTSDRDGSTVVVTHPEWREGGDEAATLTLTRADSAGETLISEQVMRRRFRSLRNTLAFVEDGVEAVRLRTTERAAHGSIGYDGSTRRFRVDGQAYELSASGME
ncbi:MULTISPECIES: hypothetical protein [Halolamina]|uniref:Uncharacterized protein n=1 Tax=Halolamina pelagica TaxID=699431 RepID=A0A1I5MBU3_9EURY|nr:MULTISPECIES: hypothetical protein [Halolamina]NHX35959.1 hypothetical protein [Halolamina sp. R1-12]SFP07064.1 hypothetical protein SAMN05216277_101200 [Halolamina pelagica]